MFDATRFLIENFGDADGVVGLLGKHCPKVPPRDTARKWFERGSVSSDWFALLLVSLEFESGAPIRLSAYLEDDNAEETDIFA